MKVTQHLFLYGSWFPGHVHFPLIENHVLHFRPATVQGSVYRTSIGFPVFVNEGHDRVPGAVVQVHAPETLFLLLDEFHGVSKMNPLESLFERITLAAWDGDSEPTPVLVYAMPKARLPQSYPRIGAGDWPTDLRHKPDLVSQLSERHRLYLERLGASNGRENMPQDLTLYRELLKMELIIDRGRRVGLSKLGQEVVRYLPKNREIRH
ncbi:MAG: gamma-glutamylcyclotransferase [Bdellovibrionales bacterium]|nr:gamma-glutamylcyclotransferase [Bdellovibrionales bacterium]